jgi:predicted amidohydrolase/ribosomal protein S18 acetylase RimI-like enzyme
MQTTQAILKIRNATHEDVPAICALSAKAYPNDWPYPRDMIRGHINNFPEGQFVADYNGQVVGYCGTLIVPEEDALSPHTWKEITGSGYGSTHNPEGAFLYGMEMFVDPDYRGQRIGQRFYRERKRLCKYLRLKGIVIGGRIPRFKRRKKQGQTGSPEDYVEKVRNKKFRDPTLSFQLRNGFEYIGVIDNYGYDPDSENYAVHLVWRNPEVRQQEGDEKQSPWRRQETVRVVTVQYYMRRVESFDQFKEYLEYYVDVTADYGADFCVFPEFITMQLLSINNLGLSPGEAIESLTGYTTDYKEFMCDLAVRYNINIIGGTHMIKNEEGYVQNTALIFLRDGSSFEQPKLHPTPDEKYWWNIRGGHELSAIPTDCGPIGVLVCYDAEFPELARHLVNQGAQLLFVPFCTDERQGYNRVRYCCQARAIENQIYVVMAGNVGNLPGVENMDIQYAQSCILTPCDFAFARDGIAADTTPNVEMVAVADLRIEDLVKARNTGTVRPLRDRRFDLYNVQWLKT